MRYNNTKISKEKVFIITAAGYYIFLKEKENFEPDLFYFNW